MEEARTFLETRNRIGQPVRLGVLRRRLEGLGHRDVLLEGLAKAGVPE